MKSYLFPLNSLKVLLLKIFGAEIGIGVVIKPNVNVKYPWKLKINNYSWIGEGVWIDNLDDVIIGQNVCISQGAMLLTGNHNYKSIHFDLITHPIIIEDGCWIAAKSIVCPGVTCRENSVLTVGSVANADLENNFIYKGNPARKVNVRNFENVASTNN